MATPSKASSAQFDVREDEEQYTTAVEIMDLLVSAGYFRAKIAGLSAFDKIVGGMVWCIALCAESVDVDLLYSENSTIGQKIALTENIVRVLPRFKCPYALEPHQIQGLDCIHILPVMRWLVKEAIEAKARTGDEVLNHGAFQFRQSGYKLPPKYELASTEDDTPIAENPKRKYHRATALGQLDVAEDVACTLMEYGLAATDVVVLPEVDEDDGHKKEREATLARELKLAELLQAELQDGAPSKATTKNDRMSAKVVNTLIDASTLESISESIGDSAAQYESLVAEKAALDTENANHRKELADEKEKFDRLTADLAELKEKHQKNQEILGKTDAALLESLKSTMTEVTEAKQRYRTYKRHCREAIAALEDEITALEAAEPGDATSIESAESANLHRYEAELLALDEEMNTSSQELFKLKSQLDSNPSQLELVQYQKRFVELYNHMSSKHREIKGIYTMYNTKVDVRDFIRKEIDLLNNIDDLKEKAVKNEYKESFVKNLDSKIKAIEANLNKLSSKYESLAKNKDRLYDELQYAVDKQRVYNKSVAEFQQECMINEQLREEIARLSAT
uniref:Coiled-coil domain-containing protein 93 n=1 Tax=Panagrellus redivivus TaxID=6233 RepID=A0A7E4VHH8_PANRE